MLVCSFHPRFGAHLADALAAAFPAHEVVGVRDVSVDPPRAAEIEVLVANRLPPGLLSRMPRLRWLQLTGVGVEHVLAEPRPDSLVLTNAGGVPAAAVAEFAWWAILSLAKDAASLADAQRAHAWRMPSARRLLGTTMTILGFGTIGAEIGARARPFGVHVIGVRRRPEPSPAADEVVGLDALDRSLARSTIVVNVLPDNQDSRRLLDARRIALLPRGSFVVSVGRASVIDRGAVVEALRSGQLGGAMLDVHDVEPLDPADAIWDEPRLWITPHCAYEYPEQRDDLAVLCVENFSRFQAGRPLLHRVLLAGSSESSLQKP